jgi:hypothetical protein
MEARRQLTLQVLPLGMAKAEKAFAEYGFKMEVISPPYYGLAFKASTKRLPTAMIPVVAKAAQEALGGDWDVTVNKDHLFIEYVPGPNVGGGNGSPR